MILDVIAGARPNFMKIAALFAVASDFSELQLRFVHTGQHYDAAMSDVFLRELGLPEPACHLEVGSSSHAVQTGEIMKRYEEWVREHRPDWTVVVGDVNSTIGCAMVAAKEGIRIAHVEAGLRSFDRTMPEEINRILTDSISDLLFASEPVGLENLAREGHGFGTIHLVGNVMVDTLLRLKSSAAALDYHEKLGYSSGSYAYVTLHRPGNVDDPAVLAPICQRLAALGRDLSIVLPVHPRTRKQLQTFGLLTLLSGPEVRLIDPVSYIESLSLTMNARMVITDSGGLQEESSVLNVPCLTLRPNTERPITITSGTNTLIAGDWDLFDRRVRQILNSEEAVSSAGIPFWDGRSARRILSIVSGFAATEPFLDSSVHRKGAS